MRCNWCFSFSQCSITLRKLEEQFWGKLFSSKKWLFLIHFCENISETTQLWGKSRPNQTCNFWWPNMLVLPLALGWNNEWYNDNNFHSGALCRAFTCMVSLGYSNSLMGKNLLSLWKDKKNPISGYLSTRIKIWISKKYLHSHVCWD